MNGFHAQKQLRQGRLPGRQSTAIALTYMGVCLSLCLTSGCAMTRNAWSGLHDATCGEPTSRCRCTCADCVGDAHGGHEAGYQNVPHDPVRATPQEFAVTPSPLEGSRPSDDQLRPQAVTMNGMPGTWTPSPAVTQFPPTAEQTQWPAMQAQPVCTPDEASKNDELKEYRTQVQILAEQIAQMKDSQESMKASQETLQQSHEREILELRLQQTTADRDRLQREHELEQQLEKQRQRELETIDSLSQIIDGVVQAPAVHSAAVGQVSRPTTQSGQVRSAPPQNLPTVDESN